MWGWLFPTIVAVGVLAVAVALIGAIVSRHKLTERERRADALALRRLSSLGDLPGEITQAYHPRGDHAAERTDAIPVREYVKRIADRGPRHRA